MRFTLNQGFASIKALEPFDLPPFAVLIGKNGVGKTQLLNGIANGRISVSDPYIEPRDIQYYDFTSFHAGEPKPQLESRSASDELVLATIEKYFTPFDGVSLIEIAEQIFNETLEELGVSDSSERRLDFETNLRNQLIRLDDPAKSWSSVGEQAVRSYFESLERMVLGELDSGQRDVVLSADGHLRSSAVPIRLAMKIGGKLAHELKRGDIHRAFNFDGDIVSNELGQLFTRYKLDQYRSARAVIEDSDRTFRQLIQEYRESERPPWVVLRAVLDEVRQQSSVPNLFNFEFSDPEDVKLTAANYQQYSFRPAFTNRSTGERYSIDSLSSGEKILLSLCFSAYNRVMGKRQPKILLLDELDAVLHPTMISALIASLNAQFVMAGTAVIMATHSVTTVSLVNEDAIFRLARSAEHVEVKKVAKPDAIDELSEGLATIEAGLSIAASESAAPITILSEGNNSLHLKKWAELFFKRDVQIFDKMTAATGKDQLKSYAKLLAQVTTNSHWLIVWDCDAHAFAAKVREELGDSKNVTIFAFSQRANNLTDRGIENLYEEKYLQGFVTTSERAVNRESTQNMSSKDKLDFANHVAEQATTEYFTHFVELEEVVQRLLETAE